MDTIIKFKSQMYVNITVTSIKYNLKNIIYQKKQQKVLMYNPD